MVVLLIVEPQVKSTGLEKAQFDFLPNGVTSATGSRAKNLTGNVTLQY